MFIQQDSVSPRFSNLVRNVIARKISKGYYTPITKNIVKVKEGQTRCAYALCDDEGWPVAWLYFERQLGWKAWEVIQSFVPPEYRGQGIATELFEAAINVDGQIVASGKTHTSISRKMWESFIRKEMFRIWAQDFWDLNRSAQIFFEDGELFCPLNLYFRGSNQSEDIRLIAIRK